MPKKARHTWQGDDRRGVSGRGSWPLAPPSFAVQNSCNRSWLRLATSSFADCRSTNPRTEDGQQDGHLRIAFAKAYESYQHTYEFNGDRYFVFDGFGRPLVPEVCIDFITDAIEWGTGGRWAKRGERREHVRGAIDFKSFGLENARSIEQVAEFGADPSGMVSTWHSCRRRTHQVRPSGIVSSSKSHGIPISIGLAMWCSFWVCATTTLFHYHSFFVDAVDPLTGAPVLLGLQCRCPRRCGPGRARCTMRPSAV